MSINAHGVLRRLGAAMEKWQVGSINTIVIGDYGADPNVPVDVQAQYRVRDQMEFWCSQVGCDHVVTTVDNFYPDGVVSVTDPRWDIQWRDVYNTANLTGLVWHASLGNHDHTDAGDASYQVEMSPIDSYWDMPDYYYDFYQVG